MREIHQLAKYFPIIDGEPFEKLKADIMDNGQIEPVVIYNGQILDGVNRSRACEALGIAPKEKEYTGKDPLHYVISTNVHRRHMTVSQLAMVATEMLPEFEKEAKERMADKAKLQHNGVEFGSLSSVEEVLGKNREKESSYQVAKEFGISANTVQRAKRVKEQAPEKIADIISGKETVRAVDTELRMKAEAERKEKAIAEGRTQKTEIEMRIEEQQYIQVLESIITKLPKAPPADWSEKFFGMAKGYANIIINRLEAFNE